MVRTPSKLEQRIIRAFAYSETGGSTPILPFLNQAETIITGSLGTAGAIIIGMKEGLSSGLLNGIIIIIMVLFVFKISKLIFGWFDLHKGGWTAYKNHWLSGLAPGRVLILNEEVKSDVKKAKRK